VNGRLPWSVDDALLYGLAARAWELRGTADFDNAIAAILNAYDRAPLTWLEQCEERRDRIRWLVAVLRDTDPSPGLGRAA
jgi:hypothetical protein